MNIGAPGYVMHVESLWLGAAAAAAVLAVFAYLYVAAGPVWAWLAATRLGEEAAYVVAAILVYAAVDPELGVLLMASILVDAAANLVAKYSLRLPRPPRGEWLAPAEGPGFPSGHTQVSAGFWTVLALWWRRLAPLAATVVALVAASRVALHVHYPVDVAGGLLLGVAVGWAVWRFAPSFTGWRAAWLYVALAGVYGALYAWTGVEAALKLAGVSLALASYPLAPRYTPPRGVWRLLVAAVDLAAVGAVLAGVAAVAGVSALLYVPGYAAGFAVAIHLPRLVSRGLAGG